MGEINKQFSEGDNESQKSPFVGLLTEHYYKIHGFILTLVPDKTDAEDILQSSITYMWEHFEDFEIGTNFLSWAVTIAKYHVLTHRKKKARSRLCFSDQALELIADENSRILQQTDARYQALEECLKKLSSNDRVFLKGRFEENVAIQDIAKEVGISVSAAYKRLSRIKGVLLGCIRRAISHGGLV